MVKHSTRTNRDYTRNIGEAGQIAEQGGKDRDKKKGKGEVPDDPLCGPDRELTMHKNYRR
jgi:hypothetical protein